MRSSIVSSLESRMSRIRGASYKTFRSELTALRSLIDRSGALKAIAQTIEGAAGGFDPVKWVAMVAYNPEDFPEAEAEYMKLLQHRLARVTTDVDFREFGSHVFNETNFDVIAGEIAAKLIHPYVTFLIERVGTESEILHIIARYTQR